MCPLCGDSGVQFPRFDNLREIMGDLEIFLITRCQFYLSCQLT